MDAPEPAQGPTTRTGVTDPLRDAPDLSPDSVEALVRDFEDCSLPREEWTHGTHLIVGLWYVLSHGPERAFAVMSEGIRRYNVAAGRTEAERNGYGARATRQWIQRIADFAREHAEETPEGTLFRRILASPLAGKEPPPVETESVDSGAEATRLLRRGGQGEEVARELFGLVYGELCAIAGRRMRAERPGHPLQATGLVHEAFARLVRDEKMDGSSRRHFFGAAAQAMRRILVDHARYVGADRRASRGSRMTLSMGDIASTVDPDAVVAVDDALEVLAEREPRCAEVVRLRFFAGLSLEETAEAMELSVRTVRRDWTYARAWLRDQVG